MSEPSTMKDPGTPPDTTALGLLEKVGQFQWMLQILSAALFLDCVLMVTQRQNLLSYPWESLSWSASIGALIVGGVAYSILIAAVLPVLGTLTAQLVRTAYIYLPWLHVNIERAYRRERNQVWSWELLEYADRLQSDYILARYKEYEDVARRADAEASRLGQAAFNTMLLLILNAYLSDAAASSTIFRVTDFVDIDTFVVGLVLSIGALACLSCISWCRIFRPSGWISYAPLYNEIEKKREEERRRMRDLS